MSKVSKKMAEGIQNTMAIVIAEMTGNTIADTQAWLKTVKTPEDFFGKHNKQGLAEYNNFVAAREQAYKNAQRRSLARI